jgi:hypothetical protein
MVFSLHTTQLSRETLKGGAGLNMFFPSEKSQPPRYVLELRLWDRKRIIASTLCRVGTPLHTSSEMFHAHHHHGFVIKSQHDVANLGIKSPRSKLLPPFFTYHSVYRKAPTMPCKCLSHIQYAAVATKTYSKCGDGLSAGDKNRQQR